MSVSMLIIKLDAHLSFGVNALDKMQLSNCERFSHYIVRLGIDNTAVCGRGHWEQGSVFVGLGVDVAPDPRSPEQHWQHRDIIQTNHKFYLLQLEFTVFFQHCIQNHRFWIFS